MHDDTVAKRFGFSGGLVPGVDVMAYMMHMPVAKWGRAFLERGLIEARFVKPVYDGETGRRHRRGKQRRAVDRGQEPRRALRDRHGVAAGFRAVVLDRRLSSRSRRWPSASRSMRRPTKSANGSARRRGLGGDAATEYLADIRETDPIYAREGLGHPGLLQRVMNKVLVDNAILGPWIHVGTRMQLLSAGESAMKSPRAQKSPAITTRRATASSSSTRWWSPTARRRWRIASTSRSTSRANRRRRRIDHAITIDYYLSLNSPWTYMGSALFAEIASAKRRHRQRQARQVRADLRADRRAAAAKALAGTAGLPDDGAEALARGAWHSAQSSSRNIFRATTGGDAPGDRGQAAGQGCHKLSLELGRAMWEREESLADAAVMARRRPSAPVSTPRRCAPPALPMPSSTGCTSSTPRRRWRPACSARRAMCCRPARSSGARTGWSCWSGR